MEKTARTPWLGIFVFWFLSLSVVSVLGYYTITKTTAAERQEMKVEKRIEEQEQESRRMQEMQEEQARRLREQSP